MPYQPTNPYPYNIGVDLREGLTLQFKVDNYDTIIRFEIEIYDLFKSEKICKNKIMSTSMVGLLA